VSTVTKRSLITAGYVLVPGSHFGAMWRHPYSEVDFADRGVYEHAARSMERYGFDLAFVPESLSLPTDVSGSVGPSVEFGALGSVRPDPAQVVAAMVAATRRLGFVVTMSTTFTEPYHIARILGTLDHFSEGRVGWNIITSGSDGNARNFGLDALPGKDGRYDRADEAVEVVTKLWASWDPDAPVYDKATGRYADPAKVRPIDHEGEHYKVEGALTLPHGPHGRPLLLQAGESERGRRFGARWGEVIFAIQSSREGMAELRADVRRRAAELGRDPAKIKLLGAVQPIVGETGAIAKERQAYLEELVHPASALSRLSAAVGRDLSGHAGDTPLTDVLAPDEVPLRVGRMLAAEPGRSWTLAEAARRHETTSSTRQIVGSPTEIADELEDLFRSEACDGFVFTPTHFPGSFDEIGRAVIPELRRRGLVPPARRPGVGLRAALGIA
jgi:FMN-dependent oxidoreductase (nitrilotriacetate monooxygenase family)